MLTDPNYVQSGAPWPPTSEEARLDTYTANRRLFDGRHDSVFREAVERRLFREDTKEIIYTILNYHKRLSTHWADLLFSEEPTLTAGEADSQEQRTTQRLASDSGLLTQVAPEVAIDMSRYGDGLFKIYLEDGTGQIESLSPTYWFPVATETNARNIQAHILAWHFERPNGQEVERFVRFETHERGRITHAIFTLKKTHQDTLALADRLDPRQFDPTLIGRINNDGVEETGLDDFLIVPSPNLRTSDDYFGRDDYTDLEGIVSELEVRISQIARILDKHADPNMYGDASALQWDERTGRWSFKGGGQFFPVENGGTTPGYVTWDGQLEAAYRQIDKLIEQFWMIAETSPSAFGLADSTGRITSGFQFRLSLIAALNKVARLRKSIGPAIRRALQTAARLEVVNNGDAVEVEPELSWRDNLPSDPRAEAETQAILVNAGLRSKLAAIKHVNDYTSDAQAEEELARIQTERAPPAETPMEPEPPT